MLRHMMKSKLHRATVTEADLTYEGSISICTDLIEKADFKINEKVDIYNCNNGERFATYVIPGKPGEVCLNGAAARRAHKGDIVIIVSYAWMTNEEIQNHKPKVIMIDESNKPRFS